MSGGDIAGVIAAGVFAILVALFAATVGGPLIKIAGFSAGVRAAMTGLGTRKARLTRK